jgi:hypothetical protein
MNDDFELDRLEDRLRREAENLSSRYGQIGSIETLRAQQRRRTTRRVLRSVAAACLVGLAIGVSWSWLNRPTGRLPAPSIVNAPARVPVENSAAPPETVLDRAAPAVSSSADEPSPIAFLVTRRDGEEVVAVGVYVPSRVERVDLSELPPLQQAAVRRLLDIDEEARKPAI